MKSPRREKSTFVYIYEEFIMAEKAKIKRGNNFGDAEEILEGATRETTRDVQPTIFANYRNDDGERTWRKKNAR